MKRKYTLLVIAFLVLASLGAAFLHHHEGNDPGLDCQVCQLAKQLVCLSLLIFFLLTALTRQAFLYSSSERPFPFLFSAPFRGRAPPLVL